MIFLSMMFCRVFAQDISIKTLPVVSKTVQSLIKKKAISGAVVMASCGGEQIHYMAQGYRDIESKQKKGMHSWE